MYTNILVPTDGSLLSARTVASAVDFARSLKARLTFLHVEPDITSDLYGEAALLTVMDQGQLISRNRDRAADILGRAEAVARAADVTCQSLSGTSNSPYEVIISVAEQQGCDLIYMASRGRGGVAGMMVGSETLKTVMHATVPVLIHSVGANAPLSARILAIIQDEHQAIIDVVNKLQSMALLAGRGGVRPDPLRLREMIVYFRDIPARSHQPRDGDLLFSLLASRDPVVDDVIADLKRQHLLELRLLDELAAAAASLSGNPTDLAGFAAAAERFGSHLLASLRREEEVVFPAARRLLSQADWQQLEKQIGKSGISGVVEAGARLLKQAYSRIVSTLDP